MSENAAAQKFEDRVAAKKMLINTVIARHGKEVIVEEKFIELVSTIIWRRIERGLVSQKDTETNQPESKRPSGSFVPIFLTLLTVITSLLIIASFFQITPDSIKNFMMPRNKNTGKSRSVYAAPFLFQSADYITLKNYCGREEILNKIENQVMKVVAQINAVKSRKITKERLVELSTHLGMSFALYGPPGTGKTLLFQRVVTIIDRNLRMKKFIETQRDRYEKIKGGAEELERAIDELPPLAMFCVVSSGIVNSRYHGESESNMSSLFTSARRIASESGNPVFIFFDEGDVFFSNREDDRDGTSATGNIKETLLKNIGQIPEGDYTPVFVFSATNRFESFDDAFKRRFYIHETLELPGTEERRNLVRFLFRDFDLSSNEVEKVVEMSKGKSHSYIAGCVHKFFEYDDKCTNVVSVQFKKLLKYMSNNLANQNMV